MTAPLHDRTIALAEGRQLEELAQMLEKEGATVLRCPMLSILDAPDPGPVLESVRATGLPLDGRWYPFCPMVLPASGAVMVE